MSWADEPDERVIRLHSPDIAFYVQSALESAQLLLLAGLGTGRGEFRVHAISDLGWPVSLLDLALEVLARSASQTPVYISGYDRGYEEIPFPGLYDPLTAGDVSPLLNAFEAGTVVGSPCPMVDAFRVDMAPEPQAVKLLAALAGVCDRTQDPVAVRGALNELSWSLLDSALRAAPCQALMRAAAMTQRHNDSLGADHRRVLEAIEDHANPTLTQRQLGSRQLGSRQLADVVLRLAASPADWIARVPLNPGGRWYERIHLDDSHEVWGDQLAAGPGDGVS